MGWAELQCGGKMASSRGPVLDVSPLNAMRVLAVEDAWHVAKAMKGALERIGVSQVVGPTAATAGARRPSLPAPLSSNAEPCSEASTRCTCVQLSDKGKTNFVFFTVPEQASEVDPGFLPIDPIQSACSRKRALGVYP